jgi:hypothetical protein
VVSFVKAGDNNSPSIITLRTGLDNNVTEFLFKSGRFNALHLLPLLRAL